MKVRGACGGVVVTLAIVAATLVHAQGNVAEFPGHVFVTTEQLPVDDNADDKQKPDQDERPTLKRRPDDQ